MRWIIAGGLAGAVLEGLLWFGIFMAMAGMELNGPALFMLGAIFGAVVIASLAVAALFKALRR